MSFYINSGNPFSVGDLTVDNSLYTTLYYLYSNNLIGPYSGGSSGTGPSGPTGYTGPVGPEGTSSNTGATGPQGLGITGSTGPQGLSLIGATGSTGSTGPQGIQGNTGATGFFGSLGNVLRVDSIYGNDSTASVGGKPYLTVNAAVTASAAATSTVPLTVWIMPGIYELSSGITLSPYTCIRGMNTQTTTIQMTNVTANTTLITVSANTRVEDLTLNISTSTNGVNITCVEFPTGTPQTSKLRTSVYNTTHTGTSGNTYGILSSGTSSTAHSTANAIRGCTINVTASAGVVGRGILVNAVNRFTIRDTNVNVAGTTTNGVGVETTNAGSIAELRTSTIGGTTYDINRVAGIIQMGFSDLLNTNSNGNSFSTTTEPSNIIFGVLGNLGSNQTYQLVPGTVTLGSLPATPFEFPFTQDVIIISTLIKFTGTIGAGVTVSAHLHINGSVTPSIIVTLNQGETQKVNNTESVVCKTSDTIHVEAVTVGNPGNGTFLAVIGLY